MQRIQIDKTGNSGLRNQIVSEISRLIFEGVMPANIRLPSCRKLAKELDVSITTVVGAYQKLAEEQLIESRPRSGFFVCASANVRPTNQSRNHAKIDGRAPIADKLNKKRRSEGIQTIVRPHDWYSYPYPFVCNQIDEGGFPVAEWRECTRLAMNRKDLKIWSADGLYADSLELIEQVNQRILPRRGIFGRHDSTLITLGSQNGLFITSLLFGGGDRTAAMEDPGYPDARKILQANFGSVRFQPVDAEGLIVDENLRGVDLVYTTPIRQFPTTATMSENRRRDLLAAAEAFDFYIVEDDYEGDVDYRHATPLPLRALDHRGRVIYLGSLSKALSPGLRLGYLSAPREFIDAARDCRGMILRHPPMILQQTAAIFIGLGYYDSLLRRLRHDYEGRWRQANDIIRSNFIGFDVSGEFGGTTFVLNAHNKRLKASELAQIALAQGIVIEPVASCYSDPSRGQHRFRLGVSAIRRDHIEPGLNLLTNVISKRYK